MYINSVKIQITDAPNLNNRIYPRRILETALIGKPEFFGQIGMPKVLQRLMIDLTKVSHKVYNLRFEDNYLVGDVIVMETPMGKILSAVLDRGLVSVDFRIAGVGNISEDGVVSDFKLISINAVHDGA